MAKFKLRIKKDDTVQVIAGREKGRVGKVVRVDPEHGKVVVEGVALVKRHTRGQGDKPGQIVQKERAIDVSNVALWNAAEKRRVKVAYSVLDDGTKVRVDRKTGARLDAEKAS
jgi:large subunit ribosomal protein L24